MRVSNTAAGSYISSTAQEGQQCASGAANSKPRGDSAVRDSYNTAVTKAYDEFVKKAAEFHDNEQCFGEELSREAYETRNKIKEAHQAETSTLGRIGIWIRNQFKYGAANANYEGLSKTKNPEEIAYAAFKTDGGDLGLKGNGLGDKLKTWHAIKDVSTLYPENITPEMVAVYKAQDPKNVDVKAILEAAGNFISKNELLDSFAQSMQDKRRYI